MVGPCRSRDTSRNSCRLHALASSQRQRRACRGWRRDMGTGGNERCIDASEGNTCAPVRHTGRARWISPISSWIHAWSRPPHELASFPACDGLMGGTKHTQVGVCRGAGIRGTGGWMLALLARLIGSPVPAWAQTVPILDERMHPHLLRVRLVFPCRPLPRKADSTVNRKFLNSWSICPLPHPPHSRTL